MEGAVGFSSAIAVGFEGFGFDEGEAGFDEVGNPLLLLGAVLFEGAGDDFLRHGVDLGVSAVTGPVPLGLGIVARRAAESTWFGITDLLLCGGHGEDFGDS